VSRSGRINPNRLVLLALAMIVSVPLGDSSARAAGCHVPDRPVLGMPLSWERDQRFESGMIPDHRAPLALTHVPCSGEVPHVLDSTQGAIGPAHVVPGGVAPMTDSLPVLCPDERDSLDPPASRLDRPPRSWTAHLVRAVARSPRAEGPGFAVIRFEGVINACSARL
jgi:hypothetical protein